jgi:hypothetical protein
MLNLLKYVNNDVDEALWGEVKMAGYVLKEYRCHPPDKSSFPSPSPASVAPFERACAVTAQSRVMGTCLAKASVMSLPSALTPDGLPCETSSPMSNWVLAMGPSPI